MALYWAFQVPTFLLKRYTDSWEQHMEELRVQMIEKKRRRRKLGPQPRPRHEEEFQDRSKYPHPEESGQEEEEVEDEELAPQIQTVPPIKTMTKKMKKNQSSRTN
jgi:hypothetical protein